MSENFPRYLVIEGPIGVGKTTLARRLAETFGNPLLLEGVDENPFLERFYQDPKGAALPVQLFFLFQRAQQMQELAQNDLFQPVRIADFLMEKDRIFAQINLDEEEYKLYQQIYNKISIDAPTPDLVIYLQAPVPTLMQRIKKRSRLFEQAVSPDYLERLSEAYMEFFYHYDAAPLLIVNATEVDFESNDEDYDQLVRQIFRIRSGRHYFNPLPLAM